MNMSGIGFGNYSQAAKAKIRVSSSVPFGSVINNRSLLTAQDSFHRSSVQFGGKKQEEEKRKAREEDARAKADAEEAVAYRLMWMAARNQYRQGRTKGQDEYDRIKDILGLERTGSPPPTN